MRILDLLCSVDAFWQRFEPLWERELLASGQRHRRRATRLHPAEILTILILFQQSGYRTFKGFSTQHVQAHLCQEFPGLLSYSRFVALMPRSLVPLAVYLHTQRGHCTGLSFIDSTSLAERLFLAQGLRLITKLRKNLRNQLIHLSDRLLLRKRALIETIFDQIKNVCQIEHSRHRSPINFLVHLLAGLAAYCHQPKKPSLGLWCGESGLPVVV